MKKTIKNILFKLEIEGDGIVNFDSSQQRFIHIADNKNHLSHFHDNVTYSKKNFYGKAGEEGFRWRIKISSDCMKKEMFGEDLIAHTSKLAHNDDLLYGYISSPLAIIRGYMDTTRKEDVIKRKGAITLCDAEQVCDAMPYLETFSKAGHREKNNGDSDKGDNTFYTKETVGKIRYEGDGDINLIELQFSSCDEIYGRYNFDPDKFELYKQYYELYFPESNLQLDYYQLKTNSIDIPEYGIKFGTDEIKYMIKEFFKRLLGMNIKRRGSYAKTATLKIKLVENPLVDTRESEDNWITISNESEIENLDFDIQDYYVLAEEHANSKREQMEKEFVEYTKKK